MKHSQDGQLFVLGENLKPNRHAKAVVTVIAILLSKYSLAEPYYDADVPVGEEWIISWMPENDNFQQIKVWGAEAKCLSPCWRSSEYDSYGSDAVRFTPSGLEPVVIKIWGGGKFRMADPEASVIISRPR